jgi:hypothetical protein
VHSVSGVGLTIWLAPLGRPCICQKVDLNPPLPEVLVTPFAAIVNVVPTKFCVARLLSNHSTAVCDSGARAKSGQSENLKRKTSYDMNLRKSTPAATLCADPESIRQVLLSGLGRLLIVLDSVAQMKQCIKPVHHSANFTHETALLSRT